MPSSYLVTTSQPHQLAVLQALPQLQALDWPPSTGPDSITYNQNEASFTIDMVRQLKQEASYRPYQASQKVVVLCHLETASLPAQNALLKILEEPPAYLKLILVTTNLTAILPTIQSRCVLIQDMTALRSTAEQLHTFPATSLIQALETAEQYKDRAAALELIDQLVTQQHQLLQKNPRATTNRMLQELLTTKDQLLRNTNPQLALESLFFSSINHLSD